MKTHNRVLPYTLVPRQFLYRLGAFCTVFAGLVHGETWRFDTSFQRTPLRVTSESPTGVIVLQSGKLLIHSINGYSLGGANGQRIGALVRMDGDTGAIDPTWNPDPAVLGRGFLGVAEAPDGKIYYSTTLAGEVVTRAVDPRLHRLIRLNANGSRDATFTSPIFDRAARFLAVQSDGKVIVAFGGIPLRAGVSLPGTITQTVRLNTDGSLDNTFQSPTFQSTTSGGDIGVNGSPIIDPQTGKIYFCGLFRFVNGQERKAIVRCNPDGSVDPSFVPTGLIGGTTQVVGRAMVLQPNGKVVLAGQNLRTAAGGTSIQYALLRFNSDGTVDPGFTLVPIAGGSSQWTRYLGILPDGKLVTPANTGVVRYLPDGAVDTSFARVELSSPYSSFAPGSAGLRLDVNPTTGAIYLQNTNPQYVRVNGEPAPGAFTKLSLDGVIDRQFVSPVFDSQNFSPNVQLGPTGAVYVSGYHTDFGNDRDATVARLRQDGTRDLAFTIDTRPFPDKQAVSFALLPDAASYVLYDSGAFNGSIYFSNLVRLSPSGAIDPQFRLSEQLKAQFNLLAFDENEFQGTSAARTIAPAPSGKVYLFSGSDAQSTVNTNGSLRLTRINVDGTEDTSVPPLGFPMGEVIRDASGFITSGSTGYLRRLSQTADGGFLILASVAPFPTASGPTYNYHVLKLRADGSRDAAFSPIALTSAVPAFLNFPFLFDPVTQNNFQPPSGFYQESEPAVSSGSVLPDGSIILVGNFKVTGEQTVYLAAKFSASGTLDTSFSVPVAENRARPNRRASIDNLRVAPGGKLWVLGRFDTLGGSPVPGVARLNPDGALDTGFALAGVEYYDYTGDTADVLFTNDNTAYLIGTFRQPGEEFPSAVTRIEGPPVITSPLTAASIAGQQFTYQFLATGATSLTVSGLPPGLTFNPIIGSIVGNPTQTGTFPVTLSASNSVGTTTSTLTVTVQPAPGAGPIISSSTAASGRTGNRFTFQIITSGGSSAARVTATNLPPGVTLDPITGLIFGTPATEGSFAVGLTVNDANFVTNSVVQLTFTADLTVPVITSPGEASIIPGQPFTYQIQAPTSTPEDPVTYTLIGNLPPGLGFDPATGIISGTPTVQVRHEGRGKPLSGGVITNVQLFATNSQGTATKPLPFFNAPTGVVNISTRLAVQTGENVLIGGFIVTGNAPKKVIIRGIGPSLSAGGQPLPGALQDPTLELRDGAGVLLGSNDDWRSAQEDEIIDTTIPPRDNREPALIAILQPGAYTAVVGGKEGGTGIGLVEFYDLGTASLDTASNAKLANISTRGLVQQNDDVMIGGFIVTGGSARLIVRAIGPSLTANGVAGAVQDTTLDLRDGQGSLIVANDDWRTGGQEQQIIDTTVPPRNDKESAVVATLNPGPYTAVVRGKNNATGIAVVEAYVLQ